MKLQNALLGAVAAAGIAGMAVAPLPAVAGITVLPGVADPIPVQPRPGPALPPAVVDGIPLAGNDTFLSVGFGLSGDPQCCFGVYGGNLSGHAGLYRIDIYGAEANFTNHLEWNDGTGWTTLFTHTGGSTILPGTPSPSPPPPLLPVPIATFYVTNPADGILPFRFSIGDQTPPITFVTNGSNPDDPRRTNPNAANAPNFVLYTNPTSSTQPRTSPFWFVSLDDANASDDDDDDLNFRITKVPTPGAILLFGVGLVGLGLARRRRAITA